jgi:hypothetical protein
LATSGTAAPYFSAAVASERKRSSAEIGFGRQMNEQHPAGPPIVRVRIAAAADIVGEEYSPLQHRCFFPSLVSTYSVPENTTRSWAPGGRVPVLVEAFGHLRQNRALGR